MFSKFRQLNGLILNTARRTYSIYSKVNSGYQITHNKSRISNLLKPASPFWLDARSPSSFQVNRQKGVFFIDVNGRRAELVFDLHEQVMTIVHTKVPKELGGHGLGKILAKSALDFALLNGYFIRIKCAFVQRYIERYEPHYAQYML